MKTQSLYLCTGNCFYFMFINILKSKQSVMGCDSAEFWMEAGTSVKKTKAQLCGAQSLVYCLGLLSHAFVTLCSLSDQKATPAL